MTILFFLQTLSTKHVPACHVSIIEHYQHSHQADTYIRSYVFTWNEKAGDDQWSPDILLVSGLRWWNDAGIVITTKYSTKYTNTLIHSLVWQSGWEIIILLLGRINWLYLFIGCDPGSCEMLVTIFQPETRANNNQYPALSLSKNSTSVVCCELWIFSMSSLRKINLHFVIFVSALNSSCG